MKQTEEEKEKQRQRRNDDRRTPSDRRREPRVLVETGSTRPDRREGPRRNKDAAVR